MVLFQVYLDICIRESEAVPSLTTHKEIRPTSFLSNLACTIPLPDFNQSPRNMYQCQMGKQTMASPIHTWHLNSGTSFKTATGTQEHVPVSDGHLARSIHTWHLYSGISFKVASQDYAPMSDG
jgi:DNA-directed RNA polymerase beta subunit